MAVNDDRRKHAMSGAKSTKFMKGQKTLFDMFGQKSASVLSSSTQLEQSGVNTASDGDSRTEIPDSTHTFDSLLSTPKQSSSRTPLLQDQSDIGPTLAESNLPTLDDSEVDALSISLPGETSSQGSRASPIVIDSSPLKPIYDSTDEGAVPKPQRPLHPFFAPRSKSQNLATQTAPRGDRTKELGPAYPDRESQHVKGIQSLYFSPSCPFARRNLTPSSGNFQPGPRSKCTSLVDFLSPHEPIGHARDLVNSLVIDPKIHIATISQAHIHNHPAIARTVDATISGVSSPSSSQLWTEVWRPRCAKEVLGNERSAIYLRNWLRTLTLQLDPARSEEPNKKSKKKTKKRPRVVREVPRKKARKDGLDGFVVDDENDDSNHSQNWEGDYGELMMDGSSQSPGSYEVSSPYGSDAPEPISEQLHNTILLTGPPGCGKTAAVFACAEELGWEVFEVYPGIGKRNGANVDNLVGDVGKNHLVRKKVDATQQVSIATVLSNSAGSSGAGAKGDCADSDGTSVEDQRDCAGEQIGDTKQKFRQSLILLEEVDLLFKDDVNFWPAVTNFIRDCRRPVICTCNDASLVPKDGLPLQKVLYFEACAPDVATCYLQGLACAEGYTMPAESIRDMYSDTYELSGADVPSETSAAAGHVELPDFDLRRAIHRLQMWCTTGGQGETKNNSDWEAGPDRLGGSLGWAWDFSHNGDDRQVAANTGSDMSLGSETKEEREMNIHGIDAISQLADVASYLDSSVELPLHGRREGLGYGSLEGPPDDEKGYVILSGNGIAMVHDRDGEMASTAIRLARGKVAPGLARGIDGDGVYLRWELFRRRAEYGRLNGRLWEGRGTEEVYTEYIPYVRTMVLHARDAGGAGRVTRNSSRGGGWEVVRVLGTAGQTAMAGTGLGDDRCGRATWGGSAAD